MATNSNHGVDIPRKTYTRKQVILMPRWGVKNIIVREMQITLPHIRALDGIGLVSARA